jgi:hypothetical protein
MTPTVATIVCLGIFAVVILLTVFRKSQVKAALSLGRFCFKLEATDHGKRPPSITKERLKSLTPPKN